MGALPALNTRTDAGFRRDISVTIRSELGHVQDPSWVKRFEELFDAALQQQGFARAETVQTQDGLTLFYWQFCHAVS